MPFAQERMGFQDPPRLFLRNDTKNADNPLGKTAFYNPDAKSVTLYVTGRHPKDVMRSLSHELVHHTQNCRGDFENAGEMGEGYAQKDEHLREMEREAYETGNLCFRDWEDSIKSTIYFEHLQKGENRMSTKDWKNKEVGTLISESWGFGFNLDKLNEEADKNTGMSGVKGDDDDDTEMGHVKEGEKKPDGDGDGVPPWADKDDDDADVQEEGVFSPNHYCIHHGGVAHNGSVHMAEAVAHNYDRTQGRVTHYTMRLQDGTILENVSAEDIQVTSASLAEGHSHPPGKRDDGESKGDKGKDKDDPKARDYTDGGDRKGDESKTHKGEKDYTTKKGDELKHSGKGRGEKKGDKAYVNEEEIEEKTKRDSPDRTGGRDAGGRRVKPLEETYELQETLKKLIRNHLRGNKNG